MGLAVSFVGETAGFLRKNSCRSKSKKPELLSFFYPKPPVVRLDDICDLTGFSKKEIQILYRGFKEACPSGRVTESEFKRNMSHWFPGNTEFYAALVFKTFDTNRDETISFKEFATALATLSRGTTEEKLAWIFYLYDVDNDGYISLEDVYRVMKAVYDIVGHNVTPPIQLMEIKEHATFVFQKFDKRQRGRVSLDEFMESCIEDPTIITSLHAFQTVVSAASQKSLRSDS